MTGDDLGRGRALCVVAACSCHVDIESAIYLVER